MSNVVLSMNSLSRDDVRFWCGFGLIQSRYVVRLVGRS